jgi:excisionase family DNA binding protein
MTPIMTSDQVAQILGCKPGTIDDYAREKKLPATKIGGSWVFTLDTLLPAINRMIESEARPKAKAVKVETRPNLALLSHP